MVHVQFLQCVHNNYNIIIGDSPCKHSGVVYILTAISGGDVKLIPVTILVDTCVPVSLIGGVTLFTNSENGRGARGV